jgi:4-amino-4-deoxy-L-arabinose transferase-like glycosyltransferase
LRKSSWGDTNAGDNTHRTPHQLGRQHKDGQEEERQEESLRQAALAEESAPAIASAHPVHFGADDMAMGHYDHVRKVKLSELSEWKLHDSGHYYCFVSGSTEIIWWVNANNAQTQSGAKVELLA